MLYLSSNAGKNKKSVSFKFVSWIVLAIFSFFSYFCVLYGYGGGGDFGDGSYPMISPIANIDANDLVITTEFSVADDLHPYPHGGLDIAYDEGTGIVAAADGVIVDCEDGYPPNYNPYIEDFSVIGNGFGNYIVIRHELGNEVVYSVYGHLLAGFISEFSVTPGMFVSKGSLIARMGSSGRSSGEHLHFQLDTPADAEYMYGSYHLNPHLYIGGSANVSVPGYNPADAAINSSGSFIFTKEMIADFGGEAFRNPVTKIVNACVKAMSFLKDRLLWFFVMLMTIDLVWGGIWGLYKTYYNVNTGGQPGVFMAQVYWIFRRILFYGFILYFYFHWDDIFINFILGFFTDLGSTVTESDVNEIGMVMSDPSKILQKILSILSPFLNEFTGYFSSSSVLTFLKNIAAAVFAPGDFIEMIISLILSFVILFIFMLICLNICLAYVEFYLASCFGFTMFCFCGENHLRRYANHAVNGMFAMGINLFFYCFYVAFICLCLQNMSDIVLTDNNTNAKTSAQQQELNLKEFRSSTKLSVDEIMSAISKFETLGDYENDVDSATYGAYHINRGKWQAYCDEASSHGVPIDKTIQKDEPNSGQYVWTKSNQDNVMRYLLEKKSKELGSWDAVVQSYRSEGNGFSNKPTGQLYSDSVQKFTFKPPARVVRLAILFCMMILSIFFLILGDRVSGDLMSLVGSGQGFHFYDSSSDERTI